MIEIKTFQRWNIIKNSLLFFGFDLNIYDSHNSKWQITQTKFKKRDITQRASRKQNQLENFVLILSSEITLVDSPRNWESQVALAFIVDFELQIKAFYIFVVTSHYARKGGI